MEKEILKQLLDEITALENEKAEIAEQEKQTFEKYEALGVDKKIFQAARRIVKIKAKLGADESAGVDQVISEIWPEFE